MQLVLLEHQKTLKSRNIEGKLVMAAPAEVREVSSVLQQNKSKYKQIKLNGQKVTKI